MYPRKQQAVVANTLEDALNMEREAFDEHMAMVTPAEIAVSRRQVQARGKRIAGGGA